MGVSNQKDIAMSEISDLNYDYQETIKNNNVPATHTDKHLFEYVSCSFCVANRTAINKILYTSEDAPEMVLIYVPLILRQNSQSGTLYFTFEMTYMLELAMLLRKSAASAKGAGYEQGLLCSGGGA